MLIPSDILDAIAAGTVTLAFRRWTRPQVRAGGRLRTAIGELAITEVDVVSLDDIAEGDAVRAGFASFQDLADFLASRPEGDIYRIALHLAGPDPRIELRERAELSADERADLVRRLDRLDAGVRGPWTRAVLKLIAHHPAERAADLAARLGRETLVFKTDVRKLKELGLTESLEIGYQLSPRGRAFLDVP
jgi:hypothetical protein